MTGRWFVVVAPALFAASVCLFAVVPQDPALPFHGLPLGPAGTVVVATVVLTALFCRRAAAESRVLQRLAFVIVACAACAAALGSAMVREGWRGEYFANVALQPPAERSIDFRLDGATRIDQRIAFRDDHVPVYFLNGASFNHGDRREVTEPYSMRWTGHVSLDRRQAVRVDARARGRVTVAIDGTPLGAVDAPTASSAREWAPTLEAGGHRIEVTYAKPPNTDALVEVTIADDAGAALTITADDLTPGRATINRIGRAAAWLVNLAVIGIVVAGIWTMARAARSKEASGDASIGRWVTLALFAVFGVQGLVRAVTFIGRTIPLSGGDDWLEFEARAREIAIGGPLMTFGQPLGHGEAYFYYPLYSYFLAVVHRLTGEDLFGAIFVQFLLLAAADVLVFRIARRLFDERSAAWAVVALVVLQQLDFVRYYTVTLLSENLYFLTAAATIFWIVRALQDHDGRAVVWAGVWGGLSSLTRPSMMLLLPLSVALIGGSWAVRAHRSGAGIGPACAHAAAWFAIVLLATLRNYVVSGRPILISTGQATSFVLYNIPESLNRAEYVRAAHEGGSLVASARLLFRLLVEDPAGYLKNVAVKVMFSLGHTRAMGQRAHPELLLSSVAYLVTLVAYRPARQLAAWPAHCFIATHLASMTLTMPGNYGYRLILPMYLFIVVFPAAFAVRLAGAWSGGHPLRTTA